MFDSVRREEKAGFGMDEQRHTEMETHENM